MNIKKIIQKSIFFAPFYFGIIIIYNLILENNLSFDFMFLISIVVSVITVLSNIFDYDYYNSMSPNDYLESMHNLSIEYDKEKWNELSKLKKINTHNLKLIKETELELKYSITFNILKGQLNSILTFNHFENKILIQIKKIPISFLPDKARNYKIIRKIVYDLKTIPAKV